MGAEVSSIDYPRMPNAILVFGPTTDIQTLDKLRPTISQLKDAMHAIHTVVIQTKKYVDILSPAIVRTADYLLNFFEGLDNLVAESDVLHKELGKLEQNMYNTLLEGKLNALKNQLAILRDANTGRRQKISELSVAISHFHEILPIFTQENSVLYKKYYLGAQLFVPIYAILTSITVIAENTPEYNNPGLIQLKIQYKAALESFRNRCVRARLQSIHIKSVGGSMMNMYPDDYYEDQLRSHFPEYFGSTFRPEEFTLKCGRTKSILLEQMPMLLDEWDPRAKSQISFSTVTLHKDEGKSLSEAMLSEKAILVYRTNVKTVMEEYFNIAF